MPKTFQEILPALEERLEQAKLGALPIGHAMELRRREKRQAMGCPSDEELCGYVDGELRTHGAQRWTEVRWHVNQCQHCQDDVEGLCEVLGLNPRDAVLGHRSMRRGWSRFIAPMAAVAAVLVLAVLGVQTYMPTLLGETVDIRDMRAVDAPVHAPALVDRQPVTPKGLEQNRASTLKVSIPSDAGESVSSVLRVAICSETERPTCGEGIPS